MKRVVTGCLIVVFVIASPFVACSVINQINRSEAMRKTEEIAKQLGVTDKDILGGYDQCAPVIINSGSCDWVYVVTTHDDLHTFETKIIGISTSPVKKKILNHGWILLSSLASLAYQNYPNTASLPSINELSGRNIYDAKTNLLVQEFDFYRWSNLTVKEGQEAGIDFFELRKLSDKYSFNGTVLRDNVATIVCSYR